ncbi:MAG: hypothetical protein ABSA66_21490 [Roseiarcus sp.]|jgi:pimeloyl-ACP methyl ester carboxylesterase
MLSHADLAVLAGRAYSGPQSLDVDGDARADFLPRGHELVVVCPGTHPDDPLDWIRDLDAFPRWFAKIGLLHGGFGSGGAALWAKVRRELPVDKRIVYAGHSLGGALAQVLAACHAADGRPPCRIVTFGAPRVPFMLNPIFGRLVRQAAVAVEYQRAGDPVPDVPAKGLFFHPTKRRVIGTALPDPIANHSIARYAADLAALGL